MPDIQYKDDTSVQKKLEAKYAKLGAEFFRALYATLKIAALYEANNNRYIKQVQVLREIIAEIFTEDNKLAFNYKDEHFFLNNFRIESLTSDKETTEYFVGKFMSLNIDGFEISPKADSREIDNFIYSITSIKPTDDPADTFEILYDRLAQLNVKGITLVRIADSQEKIEQEKTQTGRVKARKVFFQAIGIVQEIVGQAKTGAKINLTKTKRMVQSMVDVIISDEPAMIELTVLQDYDQYTYVHSVNVCVLSLILGYHLKLDKRRLAELGLGALLHDIGKIDIPVNLINKSEQFDDMDWQQMQMHPVFGVKSIIRSRGTDRSSIRAIATAYEHHITFTGGGYPQLLQKRTPCLFAQIVSICDTFNAMTSGRVYHRRRMSGDEVITNMVNRAGNDFNPLLLKVFINVIGVFPVGSVVRLSNDDLAIVTRTNPDNLENPEVKVIADKSGLKNEMQVIDLSKESSGGLKIHSVIDGDKYNIDPADFIDLG